MPKAEFQFAKMPARYRPLDSRDAADWIDGGDPQSSPSIHLDRITLPSLAAENPDTGMQRLQSVAKPCLAASLGHEQSPVKACFRISM